MVLNRVELTVSTQFAPLSPSKKKTTLSHMLPMTSFFITINLCVHSCKNFRFLHCCCCCRCCLPVVVVCLDNANTVHFTMISGMERCGILNFYSILIDKIWSPCVHLLCSVHVHVWNLQIDMTI